MLYNRGDVVLVPFPYAQDFSITKRRPALVLSDQTGPHDEVTVIMITSVQKTGDTALQYWQTANLLHPSYVRAKLVTLALALILRRIGQLEPSDLHACKRMLKTYFGLER